MLLRRQHRSTFHLGEEDGVHRRSTQRVETTDAVVGLRILVAHQHCQHARTTPPCSSHIVLKQMVVLQAPTSRACSFLSSCFLCRRDLSLDKDVYMYRGDQGFCSEECRRQQILRDEARERDAVIKKRWRGVSSIQHHHGPRLAAAPAVRDSPRRLLAVA